MKKLQENEKMILNELRKNARGSLNEIAQKANTPVSTVYEKVKGYEQDRIISKHTSLLDFQNLGYLSRTFVVIKVQKDCKSKIYDFLEKHPNVNSFYRTNSNFDYIIEIVSPNLNKTQDIIDEIESLGVVEKKSFEIIDEIKREAFELK